MTEKVEEKEALIPRTEDAIAELETITHTLRVTVPGLVESLGSVAAHDEEASEVLGELRDAARNAREALGPPDIDPDGEYTMEDFLLYEALGGPTAVQYGRLIRKVSPNFPQPIDVNTLVGERV